MNGLFKVKYDLKRSWYDPNLKFLHLNEKKQNFISAETQKNIWIPYFVFFNIESEERIEKSDKKPIIYVEPNPSFVYETTIATATTYIQEWLTHNRTGPINLSRLVVLMVFLAIISSALHSVVGSLTR